ARSSYSTRHDRRRLETRARLLRALMKLMSRKSLPDIAIHEITETADVGGGTFYNHFDDRAGIHDAMIRELIVGWSDLVGEAMPLRHDAAETLSGRLRVYIRRAGTDPDWAQYVATNAFHQIASGNPVGRRLLEMIEVGRRNGRFNVAEMDVTLRAIFGLAIATIHGAAGDPARAVTDGAATARFILKLLGVPSADADRIIALPLPVAPAEDDMLVRRAHAARAADPGDNG
ncbi:MAG: TetR/AcrR family transcriptional regulator, partial [Alphaproteobacteria bacterium]|nr:TetR/AcrR family transcriptional regulator [Alphaproteobacteria bacterium]